MRVGSLFSGIGGFDLGLEWAGFEIAWQVENDPFCLQVLEKHWPDVKRYGDIQEVNGAELEPVELICGGFPCQPFSVAGKRGGTEDDRYLWPEMLRIIQSVKPRWVIGENVAGIVNMELDSVLFDLEGEGYTCRTFIIPACAVNAPHRRDRVWIVGHTDENSESGLPLNAKKDGMETSQNTDGFRGRGRSENCGQILERQGSEIETSGSDSENRINADADSTGLQGRDSGILQECTGERTVGEGYSQLASYAEEQPPGRLSLGKRAEKSGPGIGDQSSPDSTSGESGEQTQREGRENPGRGSWKRNWLEVAQRFCQLDDGLPLGLAGCLTYPETHGIMGYILLLRRFHYAKEKEARTGEALSILRTAFREKNYQRAFRRFRCFFTPEELQCSVHGKGDGERKENQGGIPKSGTKISEEKMRTMRDGQDFKYSPRRPELEKQCSCEFDNIVCELSHEIALGEWKNNAEKASNILFDLWQESGGERFLHEPLSALHEIWRSLTDKEIGSFRRHIAKRNDHRMDKLKCLGNAVVPQIVEIIGRAIMEMEDEA